MIIDRGFCRICGFSRNAQIAHVCANEMQRIQLHLNFFCLCAAFHIFFHVSTYLLSFCFAAIDLFSIAAQLSLLGQATHLLLPVLLPVQ